MDSDSLDQETSEAPTASASKFALINLGVGWQLKQRWWMRGRERYRKRRERGWKVRLAHQNLLPRIAAVDWNLVITEHSLYPFNKYLLGTHCVGTPWGKRGGRKVSGGSRLHSWCVTAQDCDPEPGLLTALLQWMLQGDPTRQHSILLPLTF